MAHLDATSLAEITLMQRDIAHVEQFKMDRKLVVGMLTIRNTIENARLTIASRIQVEVAFLTMMEDTLGG